MEDLSAKLEMFEVLTALTVVTTVFMCQSVSGLPSSTMILFTYAWSLVVPSKYWPKYGLLFSSSCHAPCGISFFHCLWASKETRLWTCTLAVYLQHLLHEIQPTDTANIPSYSLSSVSRCCLNIVWCDCKIPKGGKCIQHRIFSPSSTVLEKGPAAPIIIVL